MIRCSDRRFGASSLAVSSPCHTHCRSTALTLHITGSAVLLTRLAVRARTVGIRQFCGDDYITLIVLLCYIGDAVTVDLTYRFGTNIDFTQAQLTSMTDAERHEVIVGSRLELLAWYSYTALIWALKACMLFFFGRLTAGLSMQTYVRYLTAAMFLSYAAVFLTITCGCVPIQKNWQIMPDPGLHCTVSVAYTFQPFRTTLIHSVQFKPQILYVTSAANVLTDALILITPIPMLWNLRAGRRRKMGLSLLLFPGVFVIAAALIRVIMSLQASPNALNINRWGVRETLAGIIAVNIPILRPMLLKAFWVPGDMSSEGESRSKSAFGNRSNPKKWTISSSSGLSRRGQQHLSSNNHELQDDVEMGSKNNTVMEISDQLSQCSNHSAADSDDFIIQRPPGMLRNQKQGKDGVMVETSFSSTVEYSHKEFRPAPHGGIPQDDQNYVRSVTHSGERK
jgi:hypothetical protein